jgi:hypothetical protein
MSLRLSRFVPASRRARSGSRAPLHVVALASLLLAAPPALQAQEVDLHMETALRVLTTTPLIDGHNDLPWQIRIADPDSFDVRAYGIGGREGGHTDIPRLREGRVGGPVLVHLRARRGHGNRRRPLPARAVRHRLPDAGGVPRALRAGPHRRGRDAGLPRREDRLHPGDGGRPRHRELPGGPPGLLRPGGPVHDADPQRATWTGPTLAAWTRPSEA